MKAGSDVNLPDKDTECLPGVRLDPLVEAFVSVRRLSESICQPLEVEDYGLQAMASTSPAKWHLAHTTWFFETFILKPSCPTYKPFNLEFEYLFNSYYNGIGNQFSRAQRSLLSRPTVEEVYRYRQYVDNALLDFLSSSAAVIGEVVDLLVLGCHHEQQHQELLLTDLKYCWFQNPLFPVYSSEEFVKSTPAEKMVWQEIGAGVFPVGYAGDEQFCFDNELPTHQQYVADFRIADRVVSNGEYLEFMGDRGYQRAELWLSDGWAELQQRAHNKVVPAPLYWVQIDSQWHEYTLHGLLELDLNNPVCHLSAYEADAFARWAECRLPTEFEWEVSARQCGGHNAGPNFDCEDGQFLDTGVYHPMAGMGRTRLDGVLGRVWQWTSSAYSPYPGFKTAAGAVGEYNGKFMANQLVLRGASAVTSRSHYRHSYRNFFYPGDQWQFTGLRLARDN
jgi:ergothioneine biosynthesis protein EgtB